MVKLPEHQTKKLPVKGTTWRPDKVDQEADSLKPGLLFGKYS
jgi:hypothetical protein